MESGHDVAVEFFGGHSGTLRDRCAAATRERGCESMSEQIHGDPDTWECVSKASSASQGWMKSTKRMRVPGGYLYQVTTEHRRDGTVTACAEALAFVPGGPGHGE